MQIFQFSYWKDSPDKDGYATFDRMCTFNELRVAVEDHLKNIPYSANGEEYSLYDMLDYIHCSDGGYEREMFIPQFRWIYCWPTSGASEGHYFHVECSTSSGKTIPLLLAKSLSGNIELALLINNEINRFMLINI